MGVKYDATLVDNVSGPAKAVAGGLKAISKDAQGAAAAMKSVGAASDQAAKGANSWLGFLKGRMGPAMKAHGGDHTAAIRALSAEYKTLKAGGGSALSALTSESGSAAGATSSLGSSVRGLGGAGAYAKGALMAVAAAAASMAVAFGLAIVKAAVWLDTTRTAFAMLARGAGAGDAALKQAITTAGDFGLEVQSAVDQYKKLLAMQFSPDEANEVLRMAGAMKMLGTSTEQTESIIRAMTQIKSKGRVQSEELLQLAEAGVSTSLVLETLSKRLGKTKDEVQKLLQAGKVTAEDGLAAIQEAVKKKLNIESYDEAMQALSGTLEGMANKIKSKLNVALLELADAVLPKLKAALAPMAADLDAALSPKDLGVAKEAVAGIFDVLLAHGKVAWAMLSGMWDGFKAGIGVVMPLLSALGGAITAMLGSEFILDGLKEGFTALGAIIGFLVGVVAVAVGVFVAIEAAIVAVVGAIANIPGWATAAWEAISSLASGALAALSGLGAAIVGAIGGALSAAASAALGVGTAIIDGIAAGISGAASAVVAAITGVVGDAISSAKALLGISSPSKVFERMGVQSVAGYAGGVEGSQSAASQAVTGMVAPPPAVAGGGGSAGGGGGKVVNISIDTGGAYGAAQTTSDPQAYAGAVKAMIVNDLLDELEAVGLQLAG